MLAMLLAVDVGNSNTAIGVFAGTQLCCELHVSTSRHWTRDEAAVMLRQYLDLHGVDQGKIDQAVIACVVPPCLRPLVEALRKYWGVESLVVGPGVRTGMPIRYDAPRDVGADRIVAAVAAHERYAKPRGVEFGVIVVDFGTATTFDVISPQPEFVGGAIAPGIGISADALVSRAARLSRVELEFPPQVVGRNTAQAMQSGLFFGYLGLIEGMIARISEEIAWPSVIVATGGFGSLIASRTDKIEHVDDSLMLVGLRMIYLRNQGPNETHALAPD